MRDYREKKGSSKKKDRQVNLSLNQNVKSGNI